MDDRMLTVARIAERLGLCKMTIYRLINAGRLPAVRVGKSYRISERDFKAYLRKVKVDGDSRPGQGSSASPGLSDV
jgi:excisionase family DNA binding protein